MLPKTKGIFAVPRSAIETPRHGDTVYLNQWWCTDDQGNVYFTNWGMALAYSKEFACRLVSERFGINGAVFIALAFVTPNEYKSQDWKRMESQCC